MKVAVLSKNGNGECYGARINCIGGYVDGEEAIEVDPLVADIPSGTELEFENGATFTTDADAVINDTLLTG